MFVEWSGLWKLHQLAARIASICSGSGMERIAPFFVVTRYAAALAKRMLSSIPAPSASLVQKAAQKVVPRAVRKLHAIWWLPE